MTLANCITVARIAMIPVFVWLAWIYGQSVAAHAPLESYRYAAIAVFLTAACSDGIDGWVARRFDQKTKLGSILDPLADKVLLVAAIAILSLTGWSEQHRFHWWFTVLVVARDVLSTVGALVIKSIRGHVEVQPHWTGKAATVTQMIAIGWIMLRLDLVHPVVPEIIAAFFTLISGMVHLVDGISQARGKDIVG